MSPKPRFVSPKTRFGSPKPQFLLQNRFFPPNPISLPDLPPPNLTLFPKIRISLPKIPDSSLWNSILSPKSPFFSPKSDLSPQNISPKSDLFSHTLICLSKIRFISPKIRFISPKSDLSPWTASLFLTPRAPQQRLHLIPILGHKPSFKPDFRVEKSLDLIAILGRINFDLNPILGPINLDLISILGRINLDLIPVLGPKISLFQPHFRAEQTLIFNQEQTFKSHFRSE